jgi:rRNA-processing protein EBP2
VLSLLLLRIDPVRPRTSTVALCQSLERVSVSKMAKNKSNKKGKSPKAAVKEQKRIVTMEALEEGASSDDEMPPEEEWTKEARALRQAIAEGAFDKLITDKNEADDDESIEEVVLDKDGNDGNDEDDDDDEEEEDEEMVADDDDEDEEVDQEEQEASDGDDSDASEEKGDLKKLVASEATDSEEEDEEEEDEDEEDTIDMRNAVSAKALSVVTEDLAAVNNSKPWAEKLAIVPPTPLPFGEEGQAGTTLDIHDDLKREVAFYDMALESVLEARIQCTDAGIPFSRPDDFFAEMVKTDGKLLLASLEVAPRCDEREFSLDLRLTFV